MYILVLVWPLMGFILSGLFGRYFGRDGSTLLSFSSIFFSFLLSLFIFYEVGLCGSTASIHLYTWLLIDIYEINFGLLIDPLTSIMILIITFISSLVHIYSYSYMQEDPYLTRFMSYLSLFTFFMLVLVTSDNFVQLFFGWEGVGVCSYLLINFWYTRVLANKAALKAMIMNRIADVFFLFGIILIILTFKTADFTVVFLLFPYILNTKYIFFSLCFNKVDVIAFFLFIGAIGKSAQLGFHTWLPDAMEGPTPVSALLHAATMVTAGVFLIVRCSPIIEHSSFVLFLLVMFGGCTTFFTGLVAIFQYDIKKIIAYSTCSQLGYMFLSCGLSNYYVAMFHLFNHAFFKALLFLCAGVIIHKLWDEQDIRAMGGLINIMPYTYVCMLIGSLAITGFPFLTGFYSKDVILELAYSSYILDSSFIYFLSISSAMFTAVYSLRLLYLVFYIQKANWSFKQFRSFAKEEYFEYQDEMDLIMFYVLMILSFCSIFIGYLFSELMLGWGTNFWQNSIYVLPEHVMFIELEFLHPFVKNLPFFISYLSMFLCYILLFYISACKRDYSNYVFSFVKILETRFNINIKYVYIKYIYKYWSRYLSPFFYHAGFFNIIYNNFFLGFFDLSYTVSHKYLEKGLFEYLGPYAMYKFINYLYNFILKISPVKLYSSFYLMSFFICVFWGLVSINFLNVNSCNVMLIIFSSIFKVFLLNPGLIFITLMMLIFWKQSEDISDNKN